MSFPEYPNSPYPDRPAMEVLVAYNRFVPGQIYWPQAMEREALVARGLIKYWTPDIQAPVNRMMKSDRMAKARAAKAAKRRGGNNAAE